MRNVRIIVGDTGICVCVNAYVGFAEFGKDSFKQAYYKAYRQARLECTLDLFN